VIGEVDPEETGTIITFFPDATIFTTPPSSSSTCWPNACANSPSSIRG
jgi:hypothetical protein